jgi:hypothetical protein
MSQPLSTKEQLSPSTAELRWLVERLPTFDPAWTPEIQDKWFAHFNILRIEIKARTDKDDALQGVINQRNERVRYLEEMLHERSLEITALKQRDTTVLRRISRDEYTAAVRELAPHFMDAEMMFNAAARAFRAAGITLEEQP